MPSLDCNYLKNSASYSWFKSLYGSHLETENYFNKSGFLGICLLDIGIRTGIILILDMCLGSLRQRLFLAR